MRYPFLSVIAILMAVSISGCSNQAMQSAAAGGTATALAADIPVGPIAGQPKPAISSVNPYAKDEIAIYEGRNLFVQYNCAGCHGGHAGGGMGPSLRDQDWIYGSSDGQVFASIAEGRAHGMPAW